MARHRDPNPRWKAKNNTTRGDTKPTLKVVKNPPPTPPPTTPPPATPSK